MSAIKKASNLRQAHLDFILLALSRSSDFLEIKENFQSFFETPISGEILIEVAKNNEGKIKELRDTIPFEEKTRHVPIADPAVQLQLLNDLYNKCLIEKAVNWNRDGDEIKKADYPTAARCIELASKIRMNEKALEFKRLEMMTLGYREVNDVTPDSITEITSSQATGPIIQIVHKKTSVDGI